MQFSICFNKLTTSNFVLEICFKNPAEKLGVMNLIIIMVFQFQKCKLCNIEAFRKCNKQTTKSVFLNRCAAAQ